MTKLRRITTPRSGPMRSVDLQHICDQCGKHRAHGDHRVCSRRRQAANRHKWEGRMTMSGGDWLSDNDRKCTQSAMSFPADTMRPQNHRLTGRCSEGSHD